jgi:hypothetical protein
MAARPYASTGAWSVRTSSHRTADGAIIAEVLQSVRDLEGNPLQGQTHGLKDTVERAIVVTTHGTPELIAAIERGEASVSAGADVARGSRSFRCEKAP